MVVGVLSDAERQKFEKDEKTLEQSITKMKMQMGGANYGKAPAAIREQHAYVIIGDLHSSWSRTQLASMEKQLAQVKKLLKRGTQKTDE